MNFDRVKQFVSDAQAAGLTIYGHTLAWHSQQQPGYLLGLMADREVVDPELEATEEVDCLVDYSTLKKYDFWHADFKESANNVDYIVELKDKQLHVKNNTEPTNWWNVQYKVAQNIGVKTGRKYTLTVKLKTSAPTDLSLSIGDWDPNCYYATISATEEMKEYQIEFEPVVANGDILFQTGAFVGDIYIESVKVSHMSNTKKIPLTAQEKHDTLVWAMDTWIAGMMEATDGYVKAWDVVNEAISGGGDDGEGNYELQNYKNNNISDPTNVSSGTFYWQVYMGDLDYMRTAVASARKHFKGNPDDLKLFVNDYNLESTWDDNKKLKSLINWVKKWEADGVTKIDGIGTQMHISCYENASYQKNAEDHIIKMFQLMAATGKLVRVSELDMGYIRGNSTAYPNPGVIGTSQVTETEHKKMADFYKFIVQKYFEIVPPEQQYGICQWCLTDAAGNLNDQGGWRNGQPVGIWTQGFKKRKAAFRGFAEGLAEK
ncbi:MAG: endo-1,4-beta-xylanase [Bacteroidales bacterium]|nr:endo-1,4-beta-xylanase [Bacteroidales bacterium]